MNITCAIIDDEPLAVSLLEKYVLKTPFLTLQGKYTSAIVALPDLKANPVDLLFLDIQMPDLNGMEFSRMVSENTRIIFTTAFEEYALESYKVNALDYLLKPIDYVDFLQSAQKALQWVEMFQNRQNVKLAAASDKPEPESESIFIRTERKLVQIELNQILYVESSKDYVKIFLEGQANPVVSLMSMKAMEELLPPQKFIRVHRSFIVQPQKIKVIERSRIVFGKEYIPISDSYRERFNEFLGRHSLFMD
jgi:DNA-binding LytR/AlgR family response regulator